MSLPSNIPEHPAKFSAPILEVFQGIVPMGVRILDPFAGVGWPLVNALPGREIVGIEIEPEWAAAHPCVQQGNALALPFKDGEFKWAITSPVYGNRMSDAHNAQERCKPCGGTGSVMGLSGLPEECQKCSGVGRRRYKRFTYTHTLGRKLHPDNAGAIQWGKKYKEFHVKAWTELKRVLNPTTRPGDEPSNFILNISNHIRNFQEVDVTGWHIECLEGLGFEVIDKIAIETQRVGMGANRNLRVDNEWVVHFRLNP